MSSYLLRRVFVSLGVILGVLLFTFSMLHLVPGDPVRAQLGRQAVTQERMEDLREELGLNDPMPVQIGTYITKVLTGDLGQSIQTKRSVASSIAEQLPSTVQLMLGSMFISILIGVPLGVVSSLKVGSPIDSVLTGGTVGAVSIPTFWLGLLLILVFSVNLGWFPAASLSSDLRGLVLPALTLGIGGGALLARLIRASMLEVLGSPYLVAARARGINSCRVAYYAFRNALVPIVTIIGLQIGYLLGGSVIIESIFARQGIGRLAIDSIGKQDFPMVQGIVMLIAVTYVLINTLTDLAHTWLDPRVRL